MPSAVRSSDSTTTMRVNEVIITRIDGASDSTVSSAISWITRSVRPVPWPKLMLMSWACAGTAEERYRRRRRETDAGGEPPARHVFPGRPNKLAISCSRLFEGRLLLRRGAVRRSPRLRRVSELRRGAAPVVRRRELGLDALWRGGAASRALRPDGAARLRAAAPCSARFGVVGGGGLRIGLRRGGAVAAAGRARAGRRRAGPRRAARRGRRGRAIGGEAGERVGAALRRGRRAARPVRSAALRGVVSARPLRALRRARPAAARARAAAATASDRAAAWRAAAARRR